MFYLKQILNDRYTNLGGFILKKYLLPIAVISLAIGLSACDATDNQEQVKEKTKQQREKEKLEKQQQKEAEKEQLKKEKDANKQAKDEEKEQSKKEKEEQKKTKELEKEANKQAKDEEKEQLKKEKEEQKKEKELEKDANKQAKDEEKERLKKEKEEQKNAKEAEQETEKQKRKTNQIETDYREAIIAHNNKTSNAMKSFADVYSKNDLQNPKWVSEALDASNSLQGITKTPPNVTVPEKFKNVHSKYLESLNKYNEAASLTIEFFDTYDISKLNKAVILINEGNSLTKESTELINQISTNN